VQKFEDFIVLDLSREGGAFIPKGWLIDTKNNRMWEAGGSVQFSWSSVETTYVTQLTTFVYSSTIYNTLKRKATTYFVYAEIYAIAALRPNNSEH